MTFSLRLSICCCLLSFHLYLFAQEVRPFFVGSLAVENLPSLFVPGALSRIKPLSAASADSAAAVAVTGKITLQPIVLEPSTSFRRLQLNFRARVVGDTTWEQNPFSALSPDLIAAPDYQVLVMDQNQTRLTTLRFRQQLYSSQWREYILQAYLPPAARSLELSFNPRQAQEIHLSEIVFNWLQQPSLLHNGDFSLGPGNYSGWTNMERMGALETNDAGKTVLNSMPNGTFRTEQFPLTAGEKYQLNIDWSEQPKLLRLVIAYQDQSGKRIKTHTWKIPVPRKNKSPIISSSRLFQCPPGTVTGTILFYSAVVHKIEVKPAAEETP